MHQELWTKFLKVIRDNISPQSYKTWFEPIKPLRLEDKVLTIQVPSQFFYEWLEEHYVSLMKKTLEKELGPGAKLEYNIIVDNSGAKGGKVPYTINVSTSNSVKNNHNEVSMPINVSGNIRNPFIIPGLKKVNVPSQLNPKYTFENFLEGDCNRLARSAGYAVANKPGGTAFNPLMIYGGVGLGKTHLAHAIGNRIKEISNTKTVLYVQADKFINQFVDSCKNGTNSDFLNFYQLVDILVVDDVQFFAKKERTQEIFFQIFNHLHQNNKQIILTSDRSPRDMKDVDDRLLSRFKWGLSCDLQLPDLETRIAILEHKMYHDGISLPNEVVEYVAHNIDSNVRELEGALVSLLAQSSLNRKEITLEMAKKMMKNFIQNSSREISIEYIQKLVSDYYGISVENIKSKTRKREITQARQISMYFAKQLTKASLKNIGAYFGGRDHSTVIHACQTVNDLIDTDKRFKEDVEELEKRIKINTL
ncbi:MAG: chromosomal replication initiator protein DnaA [Bacteroidetes bacterium MED-G17]|nr:MAG: chromosomal replication initiation protein DnaA [Bacteroidetes bacterium TMED39]PDH52632.1 MAG: chromosomal replication initiator protein DnaA [Bacteroidetes bacterium MED-G17]|tara:strand:+ start:91 stop:1521 length:1431 start_codon:yes stop_codon:yes gene_type:complete